MKNEKDEVLKPKKDNKDGCCSACGSASFIEEGLANYKDHVTISGSTVEGGCPELDIISSTIKCARCGKEYEF